MALAYGDGGGKIKLARKLHTSLSVVGPYKLYVFIARVQRYLYGECSRHASVPHPSHVRTTPASNQGQTRNVPRKHYALRFCAGCCQPIACHTSCRVVVIAAIKPPTNGSTQKLYKAPQSVGYVLAKQHSRECVRRTTTTKEVQVEASCVVNNWIENVPAMAAICVLLQKIQGGNKAPPASQPTKPNQTNQPSYVPNLCASLHDVVAPLSQARTDCLKWWWSISNLPNTKRERVVRKFPHLSTRHR